MIEKKTILDQVEILRSGEIQVRLASLLVDGDQELHCDLHRFILVPGSDHEGMLATVNSHLSILGRAELNDQAALSQLNAMVLLVHTPDLIAAYQARQAQQNKAEDGLAQAGRTTERGA